MDLNMPDVTKAQVLALTQAALGVLVAFGAPITAAQSTAVIALVGAVAVVLIGGDAAIRRKRADVVIANTGETLAGESHSSTPQPETFPIDPGVAEKRLAIPDRYEPDVETVALLAAGPTHPGEGD